MRTVQCSERNFVSDGSSILPYFLGVQTAGAAILLSAQGDYNFTIARICGTLSESKLEPWKAPIQTGSHTLAWKRDPRPEWNPALYEIVPADQLKIGGSFVGEREIKEVLAKYSSATLDDSHPSGV